MADPLGRAFDILLREVIAATEKVASFKSSLNDIKSTLDDLKPIFNEIEKLNIVLDSRQESGEFKKLLTEGEKLVKKCLKIKNWNLIDKYKYANELDKLDMSLNKYFRVFAIADLCLDGKRIRAGVKNNGKKLDKITSILTNGGSRSINGFTGCCNVPESLEYVVGLNVATEEVKEKLLNGDEQVVVISAPGGCGKTTLAKHLCNDVQIKDRYKENIFYLIVSKTTNPSLIVQKIFLSENIQFSQFQSDEDAINQLNAYFRIFDDPVLLVLDDVWSESKSFINNFIFSIPRYKVMVTSRYVFSGLYTYKLKLLNDADAITLFKKFAFKDSTSNVRDNLMKKVVKSCGGFPLALKVVGESLYKEPEVTWEKQIKAFFTTNSNILESLKPSIDALNEKLRGCFLDLASYPEDQKIPASALRDMWKELYNLNDEQIDTVDCLLELSIRNLVDLSLAREGASDIIDNCSEHFAMQHDLLRELAIYLSSQENIHQRRRLIIEIYENQPPEWWIEQNHPAFQARLLSISTDKSFTRKWCMINLPAVEILILNFVTEKYHLPQFLEGMRLLKVLIITNNGYSPAKLINLHYFVNLDKLKILRLEYISFSFFYVSQLQSKNLRKISLITCEIGNAFKSRLEISSIWPNLEEMNIDYCTDLVELPVALCDLVHLKKLCITNCHYLEKLPQDIGKLKKLEALRLHSCIKLSLLPDSVGNLYKLRALDISDCNEIKDLPTSIGTLREIREINMKGCKGLFELPQEVNKLVQLERVICDEETALLWEGFQTSLTNLEIEVVKDDHLKSFRNIMF